MPGQGGFAPHDRKKEYVNAEDIGLLLAGLGKKDEAFAWLEKAWEQGSPPVDLKVEPQYDPLRSDPRFAAMLRRIGPSP